MKTLAICEAKAAEAGHDLVSVMVVNNEIGVIQDVAATANSALARMVFTYTCAGDPQDRGRFVHLKVDLMSFSAPRRLPEGCRALFVRRSARSAEAQIPGGSRRGCARPLPTHQIVGIGAALSGGADMATDNEAFAVSRPIGRSFRAPSKSPTATGATGAANLNASFNFVEGEA